MFQIREIKEEDNVPRGRSFRKLLITEIEKLEVGQLLEFDKKDSLDMYGAVRAVVHLVNKKRNSNSSRLVTQFKAAQPLRVMHVLIRD